jgi:pimeloyl-ACP methyl ester carboxylesterase
MNRPTRLFPGVVLLHGLAGTSIQFRKMQRALQRAGFATLNLGYQSRKRSLEALAEDIHPAIARFAEEVSELHFVTHSMGGLLARTYLARHHYTHLARVVMLGPPNNGSEVADLLKDLAPYRAFFGPAGQQVGTQRSERLAGLPSPCEVGIIAGNRTISPIVSFFILPRPNDGKVSVASTKLEGMADHIVLKTSHTLMLLRRDAIEQTIFFLREGRFERGEDKASGFGRGTSSGLTVRDGAPRLLTRGSNFLPCKTASP